MNHLGGKFRKYASPDPYPKIKLQKPNLKYAELLMDDYAGMVSEFTATNQYLYHHFFFHHMDSELSDLLQGVAIVEMFHMEILSELIILLGGDPKIRGGESNSGRFWDGKFVKYGNNLCEQLAFDVDAEVGAIKNYRRHIQLIQDPYIQKILERIIKDEEHHVLLFNQQRKKFNCIR